MKKIIITTFALSLSNLLLPKNVFATVNIGKAFRFGDDPTGKGGKSVEDIFNSFSSLTNAVLPNIFVIAGIIFLVLLIFAGIGVILSSGSGNPEGTKKAKGAATAAAIGLFLIFAAFWIVQIIELLTGISIFNSTL